MSAFSCYGIKSVVCCLRWHRAARGWHKEGVMVRRALTCFESNVCVRRDAVFFFFPFFFPPIPPVSEEPG